MAPQTKKERAAEARASSSKPVAAGPPQVQRRMVRGGGWTSRRISFYASRVYFLLIILQIPLFRSVIILRSSRQQSCGFIQLFSESLLQFEEYKA
jgi:hypothetical protein